MEQKQWDMQSLGEELVALRRELELQRRRQDQVAELVDEFSPILKEMMGVGTAKLAVLEQRGYMGFARQMGRMMDKVVTSFDEKDLELLGDNVVTILETVRGITQPEVLQIVNEAMGAIQDAESAKPQGLFGMLKKTRDDDTKKGLAVVLQMLKYVGRAASRMGPHGTDGRHRRLASMLAPRALALPPPRENTPASAPRAAAAPATHPRPAKAPTVTIEGYRLTDEGFLVDSSEWDRGFAAKMAGQLGVQMTESHWALIEFVRKDFAEHGAAPNVRRIGKLSSVSTKELYQMFPTQPAIYAARIAGVPKPVGCI